MTNSKSEATFHPREDFDPNPAKEPSLGSVLPIPTLIQILHLIQTDIYTTATTSGWHSEERTFGDTIALMHSELSEALEEFRNGEALHDVYFTNNGIRTEESTDGLLNKTEGVGAELADVIIRILDASEEFGIPTIEAMLHKMEYNKTRPFRHGNKKL